MTTLKHTELNKEPLPLPIGIGDFKIVVDEGYDYVDKSMFIKEFLDDPARCCLITRPRRFGKTYNMQMLHRFFDLQDARDNQKLFAGTHIENASTAKGQSCMDLQGQYPTVFLTLKDVRPTTYEAFVTQISAKIADMTPHTTICYQATTCNPAIKHGSRKSLIERYQAMH